MQPSSQSDESVDLREYAHVLRRRVRLIAVVTGSLTILAGVYSFTRTPVYTAKASVLVQPAVASTQFRPDQLVSLETEARIVKSAPVAQIAKQALGSPLSVVDLLEKVAIEVTEDTLVLDVSYTDASARQASDGANAFADAYLQYKTDRSVAAASDKRRTIQSRIDTLEVDLQDVNQRIADAPAGSAELQDAQLERDTINAQIAVLNSEFASAVPESDPGEVILPATPPLEPSSPKHAINLAMGLFLGGFLGIVLAFVRDRTDDRISSREGLELALDAPVLATIPHATGLNKGETAWLVTERQPRSPAAEAYRTLRTAVMALGRKRDLKVFAMVSPVLGEGKTTTTANLAVALSHTDSRVLVMSADLRRPSLHRFFGRDIGVGLSDVLQGSATFSDAMEMVLPNLWLIGSGRLPVRPAELLQSQATPELFARLRDRFDFVLVDCPPILGLADTLAVTPFADAVILVARADVSKQGNVAAASDQLEQVGALIRGAVLNDVALSRRGGEYGYGYEYPEGGDEEERARVEDRRAPRSDAPPSEAGRPAAGERAAERERVGDGQVARQGPRGRLRGAGVRDDS